MADVTTFFEKHRLPLKQEFKVSHCSFSTVDLLTFVIDLDGKKGVGELSFGPWTTESIEDVIRIVTGMIEILQQDISLLTLKKAVTQWLPVSRRSVLIFEMAYLNLMSSIKNTSINAILNVPSSKYSEAKEEWKTIALGDDWPEELSQPLKLKMGGKCDSEVLSRLEKHNNKVIIDVNSGWTLEQAKSLANKVNSVRDIYIEDPLSNEKDFDQVRILFPGKKIIFDEPVLGLSEMEKHLQCYDIVNIKLQKCGGVLSALEMIKVANLKGKGVMLGCFIETPEEISYTKILESFAEMVDLDGADWLV